MEAGFWKQRWAENRIGFHRSDENPLLLAHWQAAEVTGGSPVLVPLCGKSVDLWWLRRRGHRVLGVELSERAAKAFFSEGGAAAERTDHRGFDVHTADGVSIWCGDFFDLEPDDVGPIGGLYDRAALIALPFEMRSRYTMQVARLLPPGARGLLITLEYVEGNMDGPPFSVPESEVRRLYEDTFEVERLFAGAPEPTADRFAQRGLEVAREAVYRLSRRSR